MLISQATELQGKTLFADDDTVRAQAMLATLGMEANRIKEIIPLIQDLATAKQMDLVTASDLVAKSIQTSTNALKRQGIEIEGAAGSVERFKSAINALKEAVEGQAEAAAKVGTGQLTILANQWDNVKEKIGEIVTELINQTEVIPAINKALEKATEPENFEKNINKIITVLKTLYTAILPHLSLMAQQLKNFKAAYEWIEDKVKGSEAWGFGGKSWKDWKSERDRLYDEAMLGVAQGYGKGKWVKGTHPTVPEVPEFVTSSVEAYDTSIKNETALLVALDRRKDLQKMLISQATELQGKTLFADDDTVRAQAMLATLGMEANRIKEIIPLIQDLATAKQMDLVTASDLVAKSIQTSTNALKRQGIEIEGAAGSAERFKSAINALKEAVEGQAEAAAKIGNETALLVALDGRKDLQKMLISQATELQGKTLFADDDTVRAQAMLATLGMEANRIKEIIPLIQDLATAKQMDLVTASDLVAKSIQTSTNALKRQGIEIEGAAGSAERFKSAINALKEAVEGQAEAAAKIGTGQLTILVNQWDNVKEIDETPFIKISPIKSIGSKEAETMTQWEMEMLIDYYETIISKSPTAADAAVESMKRIEEASKNLTITWNESGKDFEDLAKRIELTANTMKESISFALETMANSIEMAFAGASVEEIFQAFLIDLGRFLKKLGYLFITYGGFQKMFNEGVITMQPELAIAAGIGMIALGSAIAGAARGWGESSSGGGGQYSGYSAGGASPQAVGEQTIRIVGELRGHDIYWSNRNYESTLMP
jgi:hypothetical protein